MQEQGARSRVSIVVDGTLIGTGRSMEVDAARGIVCIVGLDATALVFFAERVGPGGPNGVGVSEVRLTGGSEGRTLSLKEATIRDFSAGEGVVELCPQ